jgi:hypothetical protein
MSDDLIERVSRAICLSQGEDPDALDVMRYCDADNQAMPLWNWYAEQAEAAISASGLAALQQRVEELERERDGLLDKLDVRIAMHRALEEIKATNQKQYDEGYAHGLAFAKLERKARGKRLAKFVMTGETGDE